MKKGYAALVLTFALAFAYLQLAILPEARQCILETSGAEISLAKAAASCISEGAMITAAILAITGAGSVYFGFSRNYFSRIYDYLEKRKKEWGIVAGITSITALFYLAKGNYLTGDALNSTALTMLMADYVRSLTYPYWNFYWYMGSAPFAFYGWLYPLISGALSIVTGTEAANKIIFYSLHITAGLLMYKFTKTVTDNSKAAIIAALAYSLSMEYAGRIMIGRGFTALTYALLPLLFLIYELRLAGKLGRGKLIAGIALTVAAMVLNHPANAAFVLSIFVIYATLRAIEKEGANIISLATECIAAFGLALLITAFWTIPIITEGGEVGQTNKLIDEIMPKTPQLGMLKDALLWPGEWGGKQLFYIGLSQVFLGLLGWHYLRKSRKFAVAATAITAATLVLAQTTRHTPAMLLMLALSAGYGFEFLSKKLHIDSKKLLFIAIIIMMVDMVPGTMQLGYVDFTHFKSSYKTIAGAHGERVLDLATDRRTFWPGMVYVASGKETVFGTLIETAPGSLPYAASISERAAVEYYDKKNNFSDETLDGLYLLGVKQIILHPEQRGKNPSEVFVSKETTLGLEKNLQLLPLKDYSPIIASGRITTIAKGELWKQEGWYLRVPFEERTIDFTETEEIIRQMKINRSHATAAQILSREGENESLGTEPEVTTGEVTTTLGKAEIKYKATERAYLQPSYSYSPHLKVMIDSKEIPYKKTAIGTLAIETPEGEHTLTIEGMQSMTRKALGIVSAIALLATAFILIPRKKKA